MAFNIAELKVVDTKSTLLRDTFIALLKKNGFREVETNNQGWISLKYKVNDWLYVRANRENYEIRLFGDHDTYIVKKVDYTLDSHSQQPEGFFVNCILKNI